MAEHSPPSRQPRRWLYVALLLSIAACAVAAIITWPLYGAAATVVVAVVLAILPPPKGRF